MASRPYRVRLPHAKIEIGYMWVRDIHLHLKLLVKIAIIQMAIPPYGQCVSTHKPCNRGRIECLQ